MHSFKDKNGLEWPVSITIGAVKRVKGLLPGVDLLNLNEGEPPLIQRLSGDIVLVVDVVFALCKSQADAAGIKDEDFAELLEGDSARQAWEALQNELTDFFQKLGRTEVSRTIKANADLVRATIEAHETKVDQLQDLATKKLHKLADNLDLEALLEAEIDPKGLLPGKSSTAGPASSA